MAKSKQMPVIEAADHWLQELHRHWLNGSLVKLTLSKNKLKADALKAITARPLVIKKGLVLGLTYRYATRDEAHNYPFEEAIEILRPFVGHQFLQADAYTTETNVHLYANRNGTASLLRQKALHHSTEPAAHNREKPRLLQVSAPYLNLLGVTFEDGSPRPGKEKKYRQIFHYIEIVGALLQEHHLGKQAHIVDAGSGKGYLTFALYDFLTNQLGVNCTMVGIELRPELVAACNGIAQQCGFSGLTFVSDDLKTYRSPKPINMLIALHACDIATDYALARGMHDQADIIVVAPCCHKQVRRDMRGSAVLAPLLKHGILRQRVADWLTDGLRALILERQGYRTRTMEFIEAEHTPKNLLITAVKSAPKPEANAEIAALKQLYGLEKHFLETLL